MAAGAPAQRACRHGTSGVCAPLQDAERAATSLALPSQMIAALLEARRVIGRDRIVRGPVARHFCHDLSSTCGEKKNPFHISGFP